MIKHSFDSEVLTPLFLGGAEAREKPPEVRVPSIRGAMRYWYRALLGGSSLLQNDNPLITLHKLEGEVFGTTDYGASLTVRQERANDLPYEIFQKDRAIKTPQGDYMPTGKDYLLWSMASTGKPGTSRFQSARQYIKPGAKFGISLSTKLNQDALNKGVAAFWLLTNLGALGSRSNRGAGSLQVFKPEEAPIPFRLCQSLHELQNYLKIGINKCLETIGESGWPVLQESFIPEFDILHPQASEIWVVSKDDTGWATYLDALNGLGEKLRDFRTHLHPLGKKDHDAVLEWFTRGGEGPQINRAVFGLPIPFRYSEGGPSDVIIPENGDRRNSPLQIRITQLTTGKYVGVLVLFKSRFLPAEKKLQLQERKWTAPPPPNYDTLRDFIAEFPVKEQVKL